MSDKTNNYVTSIFARAEAARVKAQDRFRQPNYVALKVAEEAGEVVRAAVHYAERRLPWQELEAEVVQMIAMGIRLLVEGDQVNGIVPPHVFPQQHPDDIAVDRFAAVMKEKLARKRAEGFGGWDDPEKCSVEYLEQLLVDQIRERSAIDPIDVGNFAMMIHQHSGGSSD